METTSNSTAFNFTIPVIRFTESNIKISIEKLKANIKEKNVVEIMHVCDRISDTILICEDEPPLTLIQNCSRRVTIASELLLSVCSLYEGVVNCEFMKTVNDLLDVQNFKTIYKKLRCMSILELKERKFFTEEAVNIIKKSLNDKTRISGSLHEEANEAEKENENLCSEIIQEEPKKSLMNDELGKAFENVSPDCFTQLEDLTKIRGNLDVTYIPTLHNKQPDLMPDANFEMTFLDPVLENESSFKIQNGFLSNSLGEIVQPEVPGVNFVDETKLSPTNSKLDESISETSSKLKLQSLDLEELTPRKKPRKLIKDKNTVIHNYSKRALELNRNIDIRRVSVYDVPPFIKKAFSVSHLMSTPAFKNSLNQSRKNEILGVKNLYKRHLKTEHKPSEIIDIFESRTEPQSVWRKKNETLFQEVALNEETIEKRRLGKKPEHSLLKDFLLEIPRQSDFIEPTLIHPQISVNGFFQMPDPICDRPPEVKQQEKTTPLAKQQEPIQSPSPRKVWSEFKFVEKILEKYWSIMEMENGEKSIAAHELLKLENELTVVNYLTLIRVLDKMSLQRNIYLKYTEEGVMVAPFNFPFVTQHQNSLKQNQLLF